MAAQAGDTGVNVVDLNLLLYAVNSDAPRHEQAREWWEGLLSSGEVIGLPWTVILGFIRLSTRPGVLPRPLSLEQAVEVVDDWTRQPAVMLLLPGEQHWQILRGLLQFAGTAGNLTTDAHLAALAIEHDALLCSSDSDFARFSPPLRFLNPLA